LKNLGEQAVLINGIPMPEVVKIVLNQVCFLIKKTKNFLAHQQVGFQEMGEMEIGWKAVCGMFF